ncbi:MAG: hypothetical protein ACHREM_15720, partial [Polyangiales bacterium]
MRTVFLSVLGAASLFATSTHASTILEPASDAGLATPSLVEARTAFTASLARTVAWEQLVVTVPDGGSLDRLWLVAVPDGGRVELASGAWLDALDYESAARFHASSAIACGETWNGDALDRFDHLTVMTISDVADLVGVGASGVADLLVARGFDVDSTLRSQLASLATMGEHVVAIAVHATAAGTFATPSLRVVGPASRALPAALAPASSVPLRLFILAPWRASLDDALAEAPNFEALSWQGTGVTNYDAIVDAVASGLATTYASRDALLFDTTSSNGTDPIASIANAYFGVDALGAASDTVQCAATVTSERLSSAIVAPTCARSALFDESPSPGSCASVASSTVDPATLVCADRDDLAVALGGLGVGTT